MNFIAIDVETANRNPGSICQIGGCIFTDAVETDCFSWLVNPEDDFDARNVAIHGISENQVANAASFEDVADDLRSWMEDAIIVSHGSFDRTALKEAFGSIGEELPECQWLDSCSLARRAWPASMAGGHSLKALAGHFGIAFQHHDALHDARTAGLIAIKALGDLKMDLAEAAAPYPHSAAPARQKRTADRNADLTITLHADIGRPLSRSEMLTLLLQINMNTFHLSQSLAHALEGQRKDAAASYEEAIGGIRETAATLTQLARAIVGQAA